MKDIIKKVPIPLCGVMLGTAALGNLLQSYGEGIRNVCGIFAAFLLILVLLKLIMFPGMIKEDMGNPIMASVSGTFTMALMILSTYVKPYIGQAAYIIWLLAIILHIVLIVYFTAKFVVKLQMPKVFASYYIVYVGIVVAAVTAPAYEQLGIGAATFWFGFVTLILLLVLVTYRYVKFKEVPNPAKPLICIYAAPTSLCIAGYVQSVTPEVLRLLNGNVCSGNSNLHLCTCKSCRVSEITIFPKLCCIYLPICNQCDCIKTDNGMRSKYGTPDAVPSVCGSD